MLKTNLTHKKWRSPFLNLAVFAEVVCSMLILFGVGTRLATIPLMFTMLVAVLYIHSADQLAKKEVAILYLLAYVILFFTAEVENIPF